MPVTAICRLLNDHASGFDGFHRMAHSVKNEGDQQLGVLIAYFESRSRIVYSRLRLLSDAVTGEPWARLRARRRRACRWMKPVASSGL